MPLFAVPAPGNVPGSLPRSQQCFALGATCFHQCGCSESLPCLCLREMVLPSAHLPVKWCQRRACVPALGTGKGLSRSGYLGCAGPQPSRGCGGEHASPTLFPDTRCSQSGRKSSALKTYRSWWSPGAGCQCCPCPTPLSGRAPGGQGGHCGWAQLFGPCQEQEGCNGSTG